MANSSFARPGRSPALPPITRDRKTPARFAKAVSLHQAGHLDRAVALYRRILQREPDLSEVHGNLGTALAALGRLSDAAASYRRAAELARGNARAGAGWGFGPRGPQAVRRGGREASSRHPAKHGDFTDAHCQLGAILRRLGRLDAAEAMLRRAITLDPNHAQTHAGLGGVLLDRGQPREAVAAFRQAVALEPDLAGAHNNLSLALKEAGRLAEAGHAAEEAIRLAPRRAAYYANLAEVRAFAENDPHVAAVEALTRDGSLRRRRAHARAFRSRQSL